MASNGKRKRGAEPKVYAVRVGIRPGIYHNYEEAAQQIKGFKGASWHSFSDSAEAQIFMESGVVNGKARKYYAVRVGRAPGIYTDWPTAQAQVIGFAKPKYKSFTSRDEAEAFMRAEDPPPKDDSTKVKKSKKSDAAAGENDELWQPGVGRLPKGALDGFDDEILLNPDTGRVEYKSEEQMKATKMMPTSVAAGQPLRIYTDGSSLANGRVGAMAGVGVYFGPQDPRNISDPLAGNRQTNQRAELTAVQRAINIAPRDRDILILTDSKYSIQCCTDWFQNWRRNGWLTSDKKPVENRDLIEAIVTSIDERNRLRVKTKFEWIKGHANDEGNIAADRLAVEGARRGLSLTRGG